jgi:4a-hydroxytetrahydrobiopterin dehydratase
MQLGIPYHEFSNTSQIRAFVTNEELRLQTISPLFLSTMSRPKKLSPAAVSTALTEHPHWKHVSDTIEQEFKAADFASALGFINAVGVLAETADHHPDILLHGWNKVKITLSTHDQGGLTDLDFALAAKIDAVKFPLE